MTPLSPQPGGAKMETKDGSQIFRIVVDVGAEFNPTDLHVKTVDKKLVIQVSIFNFPFEFRRLSLFLLL